MYTEITRSRRVYKLMAPATKPSCSKPMPSPPTKQLPRPTTEENLTKPTSAATLKKDQPSAGITAQLMKVKANISIWDLIYTSLEHREAFLRVL